MLPAECRQGAAKMHLKDAKQRCTSATAKYPYAVPKNHAGRKISNLVNLVQ